jgi:hypothetical protein
VTIFELQLRVEAGYRLPLTGNAAVLGPTNATEYYVNNEVLRSSTDRQCQQDCYLCKPTGPNLDNGLRAYYRIRLCHWTSNSTSEQPFGRLISRLSASDYQSMCIIQFVMEKQWCTTGESYAPNNLLSALRPSEDGGPAHSSFIHKIGS